MPDFSMCEGGECPLKARCHRFKATPNQHRQSWFVWPVYEGDECEYLLTIKEETSDE